MVRSPSGPPSSREAGLRWLARGHETPVVALQQAIDQLNDAGSSQAKFLDMRSLVDGVEESAPSGNSSVDLAAAMWALIQDCADGLSRSESRVALTAVFRLDPENSATTIDRRLEDARDRGLFGSKQIGYERLRSWWGVAIRQLGYAVEKELDELRRDPAGWSRYLGGAGKVVRGNSREPSKGAQPVRLVLFITTVFMEGRALRRRLTERLVIAQEDDVAFYTSRASPAAEAQVAVNPLWGCRAEALASTGGEPVLTKLWFPVPLRRGQMHWFSSEVVDSNPAGARRWINVEVDHHGIDAGRRQHDELLPVAGLTIRIVFDEEQLPEACWWYAEVAERERYIRPATAEGRDLPIVGRCVEHTFANVCEPRENYGVSISWPQGQP